MASREILIKQGKAHKLRHIDGANVEGTCPAKKKTFVMPFVGGTQHCPECKFALAMTEAKPLPKDQKKKAKPAKPATSSSTETTEAKPQTSTTGPGGETLEVDLQE